MHLLNAGCKISVNFWKIFYWTKCLLNKKVALVTVGCFCAVFINMLEAYYEGIESPNAASCSFEMALLYHIFGTTLALK